ARYVGSGNLIFLGGARGEVHVAGMNPPLRHLVALVDVAPLAVVERPMPPAIIGCQLGWIGEQIILEWFQQVGCRRLRAAKKACRKRNQICTRLSHQLSSMPPASAMASGVSTSRLAASPSSTSITAISADSTIWRAPVSPARFATEANSERGRITGLPRFPAWVARTMTFSSALRKAETRASMS